MGGDAPMTKPEPDDHRRRLRADCERCAGLCCVAPAFGASADFALTKPAGVPCPNLGADHRCGIHARLRSAGFGGCAVYDCFGAGQQLTQITYGGRSWRDESVDAQQMFDAYAVMRDLHELLWYLYEAEALDGAGPHAAALHTLQAEVEALTAAPVAALLAVDRDDLGRRITSRLDDVSTATRAGVGDGRDVARADLIGRDLSGRDLRGARMVGALLLGASLVDADLRHADVRGADLRGADLAGADLTDCLFLSQSQLDAARGDHRTRLPAYLRRPTHWVTRPAKRTVSGRRRA